MSKLAILEAAEHGLDAAGIPRKYWTYVACNGNGDGLGTWTPDREWILKDMAQFPQNSLQYTVVDGRDKEAIRLHVGRSWDGLGAWHTEENRPWTATDSDETWNAWLLEQLTLQ